MAKIEMKPTLAVATLVPVLALTATGCGGGKSPSDVYASSVCTAIGNWVTAVRPVVHRHRGETITQASVEAKVERYETATQHLAFRLKAVPAPKVSDARAVKQEIDRLATQFGKSAADEKVALANVRRHATRSDLLSALEALAPQFEVQLTTAQATLASPGSPNGPLAGALSGSSVCKQLG